MIEVIPSCKNCIVRRKGYTNQCKICGEQKINFVMKVNAKKQFDNLEKFMIDRPINVSINHIKKLFGISKSEAIEYYWKWRKEFMIHGDWSR